MGKMDCFGVTHVGRRRPTNEDQFLIADLNKSMRVFQTSLGLDHQTRLFGGSQGKLLLVADGMGGHEAGERASQLVVDTIVTYALNTLHWFFRLDTENDEHFCDELKEALLHCQTILQHEVESIPQRAGMGTTLTMAYLVWPRMYIVHVGDSRCYLLRDGKLKQLTRDHTVSQLHKESIPAPVQGEAPEDEEMSQWSHVLWNVISNQGELTPEVYLAKLKLGDAVLLSTDGLHDYVKRDRIIDLLQSEMTLDKVCNALVEEANDAGGPDNITVVVSRFFESDDDPSYQESHAELPLEEYRFDDVVDPVADTTPPDAAREAGSRTVVSSIS